MNLNPPTYAISTTSGYGLSAQYTLTCDGKPHGLPVGANGLHLLEKQVAFLNSQDAKIKPVPPLTRKQAKQAVEKATPDLFPNEGHGDRNTVERIFGATGGAAGA